MTTQEQTDYVAIYIMGWREGDESIMENSNWWFQGEKGRCTKNAFRPHTRHDDWRWIEEVIIKNTLLWATFTFQFDLGTESLKVTAEDITIQWINYWNADLPTRVEKLITAYKQLYPQSK